MFTNIMPVSYPWCWMTLFSNEISLENFHFAGQKFSSPKSSLNSVCIALKPLSSFKNEVLPVQSLYSRANQLVLVTQNQLNSSKFYRTTVRLHLSFFLSEVWGGPRANKYFIRGTNRDASEVHSGAEVVVWKRWVGHTRGSVPNSVHYTGTVIWHTGGSSP